MWREFENPTLNVFGFYIFLNPQMEKIVKSCCKPHLFCTPHAVADPRHTLMSSGVTHTDLVDLSVPLVCVAKGGVPWMESVV